MEKSLVVIVDEEARRNLESLSFRWFYQARSREDREYTIEDPLGREREIIGTLIEGHRLNKHSEEYLYLELTDACKFSCSNCGIREDIDPNSDRYMTAEFAETLAEEIRENSRILGRDLFYGGGEPLSNKEKFMEIHQIFKGLDRTRITLLTNGYALPINEEDFTEFIEYTGLRCSDIYFSISEDHQRQYGRFAMDKSHLIPETTNEEEAIYEKVLILGGFCEKLDIRFTPLLIVKKSSDLRENPLKKAIEDRGLTSKAIELYGSRYPCSQGQELSIRINGDMYPHCYDIFRKSYRLGVVGLRVN